MSDSPSTTKRKSYQPEYVYGSIHDANGRWTGEYGLKPWPAHLQPRQATVDSNASSEPTAFLAVTPSMRTKLAATCEALIALLDEIDGDAEEEPILGSPEMTPTPYSGKRGPVYGAQMRDGDGDQTNWAAGEADDREDDGDDLEPEPSGYGDQDAMEMEEWGEPDLGFCGFGTGWREGETTDDREEDAGDDRETEHDGGVEDEPCEPEGLSIWGGGSVSQHDDGWRPDPSYVPPVKKKRGRQKQSAARKGEVLFRRDDPVTPPRYMTSDPWTRNLPPEANEVLIPHIDLRRAGK